MRPVLMVLLLILALGGCSPAMQGSWALSRGDHAEALARYNEALAKEPDSLFLRQRIGLTYLDKGDYATAEGWFRDVLSRSPGEPEAFFYLGLSRIGKGEVAQGLEQLTQQPWPFKFYHHKFVREEAQRLQHHPEMPPAEMIRSLEAALEKGREEQKRYEIESLRMNGE